LLSIRETEIQITVENVPNESGPPAQNLLHDILMRITKVIYLYLLLPLRYFTERLSRQANDLDKNYPNPK